MQGRFARGSLALVSAIAFAGCLAPAATPSPTPAPTASPSPPSTPSPSPTASPEPTPSDPPTASPELTDTQPPATPAPTPTATAGQTPLLPAALAWQEPEQVATGDDFDYTDIAVAADASGYVHIVAGSRDGIEYITNASGAWQSEMLSSARSGGYDGSPAIAIGGDGSLTVVFVRYRRWSCEIFACAPGGPLAVQIVSHGSDGWTSPQTVVEAAAVDPSLALRDGMAHVVYELAGGIEYAMPVADGWSPRAIAGDGSAPFIALASDGTPRVAFVVYDDDTGDFTLLYATGSASGETWDVVPGPALGFFSWPVFWAALDATDRLHLVGGREYRTLVDGTWSEAIDIFGSGVDGVAGDMALGSGGVVHVVTYAPLCQPLHYIGGISGDFSSHQLTSDDIGCTEDGPQVTQAIAVDAFGQPHVVFSSLDEGMTLWYARGDRP
jgi:hypothetical protein